MGVMKQKDIERLNYDYIQELFLLLFSIVYISEGLEVFKLFLIFYIFLFKSGGQRLLLIPQQNHSLVISILFLVHDLSPGVRC
jgi:hypothetical protein